jgi:hypothetical protein
MGVGFMVEILTRALCITHLCITHLTVLLRKNTTATGFAVTTFLAIL